MNSVIYEFKDLILLDERFKEIDGMEINKESLEIFIDLCLDFAKNNKIEFKQIFTNGVSSLKSNTMKYYFIFIDHKR